MILMAMISSCKKYPDGPWFDFRSKSERAIGEWDVNYFSVDGNDSTTYLKSQPYYGQYHFERASGDKALSISGGTAYYTAIDKNYESIKGRWYFSNSSDQLIIEMTFNYPTFAGHVGPYRYDIPQYSNRSNTITWDIRRLSQHALWLQTTQNGKVYYLKLESA